MMSQHEERGRTEFPLSSVREDSAILNNNDESIVTNDQSVTTPVPNPNSNKETKTGSFIQRGYGNIRKPVRGSLLSNVTLNKRYNNRHSNSHFGWGSDGAIASSDRSTNRDSGNGYNNRPSSVSLVGDGDYMTTISERSNSIDTHSSMKKEGNNSRNLSVHFGIDFPEPKKSKTKFDSSQESLSVESLHDSILSIDTGSEEDFFEPHRRARRLSTDSGNSEDSISGRERSQRRRNSKKARQNHDSLAVEVEELAMYLSTLKQSIVDTKASISIADDTYTNNTRGTDDSSNNLNGSNDPKSRRRFSMAFRTTDEVVTFPDDCFSFLIIHGPIESPWFFFFGLLVSLLQLLFLIVALWSQIKEKSDNPNTWLGFIPADVTIPLRFAQILAVLSYCMFAETSLKDFITAIELWPQYSKLTKDDKYGCMVFSCLLRGIMGLLTAFVTVVSIMMSDDVIDTILDFLAMTFISDIGKMAFQLALWGKYGPKLEEEARRLEDEPMPECMIRNYSSKRYLGTIIPILLTILVCLVGIIIAQAHDTLWRTTDIRVQFVDNADLEPYSGCYNARGHKNQRILFKGFSENSAKFGYCSGNWFLFDSEDDNPCNITSEETLAQSSSTVAYDISAAFSGSWLDTHGRAIDLYFMKKEDHDGTCDLLLNDGHCDDQNFNKFDYDYDGGDCCASTCTKSNCGVGDLEIAFGSDIIYGDGFPQCKDPAMVPITIKLQDVFKGFRDYFTSNSTSLPPLRVEDSSIIEPIMLLDCDDKNILTANINENMIGQMETVMVEDGANCTMRINNSTSSTKGGEKPIWYVNYTIYHGDKTAVEEDPIVILQEQSVNNEYANFERIPECYLAKLSDHLDNSTIYMGTGPQNRAIKWLQLTSRTSRNSLCEDDYFIERYALSVLNFAAPVKDELTTEATEDDSPASKTIVINALTSSLSINSTPEINQVHRISYDNLWIKETRQCIWRSVECNGPSVKSLDLRRFDLSGSIASSIGILTSLESLSFASNSLTGSIPSEIGTMTALTSLNLSNNSLTGSIPDELGILALHNLTSVYLAGNSAMVWDDYILAQLSGVLYRECDIVGCRLREDIVNNPGVCEAFEQNQKMMTIDDCGRFQQSCFAACEWVR